MIRKIKVSLLFGEKRGKSYLTFFLSDEKERTQCSLSFERPKESEPKACPEAKPKGKAVGVALSANH